jgi:hypothetical protein
LNVNGFLTNIVLKIDRALLMHVVRTGHSNMANLVSKLHSPELAGDLTIAALSTVNSYSASFFGCNVFDVILFGTKREEARLVIIKNQNGAPGVFFRQRFASRQVV